jgi:Ca2+-binding EF-hand superfamily protein
VLPQLHPQGGDAQVQWAVKAATPEMPENSVKPEEKTGDRQVPEEAGAVPSHLQPVLKDFSALLRDRYEGKRSLRLAFLNWDRDKDGQLSLQEIRDMVQTLGLTKKLGHQNVEAILAHVATTPSQSLRYHDFCGYVYGQETQTRPEESARNGMAPAAQSSEQRESMNHDIVLSSDRALYPDVDHVVNILRKKYETRHQLRQVFRHWDTDKDGSVTVHELDANLRRQGVKLPRQQLRELFAKHDANQDGRLLYHEFVKLIYGDVTSDHHNSALQNRLLNAKKEQPQDAYQILKGSTLQNPTERIDVQYNELGG